MVTQPSTFLFLQLASTSIVYPTIISRFISKTKMPEVTPRGSLTHIGNWKLGRTLGRGAYAHVRLAILVVVKQLARSFRLYTDNENTE
jgi:hypothetical protein